MTLKENERTNDRGDDDDGWMEGRRIQERREGGGRKGNCETGQDRLTLGRPQRWVGCVWCVGDKQVGGRAELDGLLGLLDDVRAVMMVVVAVSE